MANTHDYSIANDTGSAVRSDLNTLFAQQQATNAGTSAPTSAVEGMLWEDTTNNILKQYDGSSWVEVIKRVGTGSAQALGTTDNVAFSDVTLGASDATYANNKALKAYVGTTLTDIIPGDGTAQALGTGDSPTFAGLTLSGDLVPSTPMSHRNMIINGAMQVAQRATSVSSQTGSGYKTVDRIYTNASGSTYNQSQQTVTVGGETGLPTQFTKFLRHDVTTSNDNAHFYDKIEGVASVPEGTVTLSFYAKGTTPTGGVAFNAYQNFGTGGSPSGEVSITISDTVTLTSTWQRFSVNITVPSITGKTLGTNGNDTFYVGIGQFTNTSTSAYQLDITGVQLELGSSATPFEYRSYGEELALCQRYYQNAGADGVQINGFNYSGHPIASYYLPVEMRASPAAVELTRGTAFSSTNASGQTNYTAPTSSSFSTTTKMLRILLQGGSWSGSGNDRGNALLVAGSSTSLDAEL